MEPDEKRNAEASGSKTFELLGTYSGYSNITTVPVIQTVHM